MSAEFFILANTLEVQIRVLVANEMQVLQRSVQIVYLFHFHILDISSTQNLSNELDSIP